MWFNLAAAQGNAFAEMFLRDTTDKMTPDQIAEAQKLAREWKPNTQSPFSLETSDGTRGREQLGSSSANQSAVEIVRLQQDRHPLVYLAGKLVGVGDQHRA